MLLTITYRGKNAANFGFLLHKHPDRAQIFKMSFGQAYVFYPEVNEHLASCCLLIDINPLDLARGKELSKDRGLFNYVNDRPYVSSSFMCTAIAEIFSSAMNGRSEKMPELAASPLDLEAKLTMLPCRGTKELIEKLFSPLGYKVSYETYPLDENFPQWGESGYINLTLRGTVRLSELLNHLYIFIPVFDRQKHYYMSEDEIDKLIRHGKGWLSSHPELQQIAERYFFKKRSYANEALNRLIENDDAAPLDDTDVSEQEEDVKLNTLRLNAVKTVLMKSEVHSVIDLGCGDGRLLSLLISEQQITKLAGTDVSSAALEKAKRSLRIDSLSETKKNKLSIFHSSLTYRDSLIEGYDAACLVEVIEHIEPSRLQSLERAVFEYASPSLVIVTTPNSEYNILYKLTKNSMRHGDHRFEWTRQDFAKWTKKICDSYGYSVSITGIGAFHEALGNPTQMGVFSKCR